MAFVTDRRFSGATRGLCIGHVCPEAAAGGPLALLRDGDLVAIDASPDARSLSVELDDATLAARRAERRAPAPLRLGATLEKYAATVGSAHPGAATHSGGVVWERDA